MLYKNLLIYITVISGENRGQSLMNFPTKDCWVVNYKYSEQEPHPLILSHGNCAEDACMT